jgi:hypothetical protein
MIKARSIDGRAFVSRRPSGPVASLKVLKLSWGNRMRSMILSVPRLNSNILLLVLALCLSSSAFHVLYHFPTELIDRKSQFLTCLPLRALRPKPFPRRILQQSVGYVMVQDDSIVGPGFYSPSLCPPQFSKTSLVLGRHSVVVKRKDFQVLAGLGSKKECQAARW